MSDLFSNNPSLNSLYEILRVIIIVLDIILLITFIYAFRRLLHYRPPLNLQSEPRRRVFTLGEALVKERWEKILKKISVGTPDSMALAVIDADKLVDDALKSLGLEGKHMADRLGQLSPDELKTFDRVWRAHRLRNELVHSPDYKLTYGEAERALSDFEEFLKEVRALS